MKSIIWNAFLPWLIGFGILIAITLLVLISTGEMVVLFIAPIAFGIFVIPITTLVAGFRVGTGHASFHITLLITVLLAGIIFVMVSDTFRLFTSNIYLAIVPIVVMLVGLGFAKLLTYTKSTGNILIHNGSISLGVIAMLLALYFLGAFQSHSAYLALPRGLFYTQTPNEPSSFVINEYNGSSSILFESLEHKTPYTGKIISYKERLSINFWSKKPSGIAYYINGMKFGESGDITLPTHYNSWYGSYNDAIGYNYNEHFISETKFLLHNNYQNIIEREFPDGLATYYKKGSDPVSSEMVIVFADEDKPLRKNIAYYPNGVINYISVSYLVEDSWNMDYEIYFDNLGYTIYDDIPWNADDFLVSDFNSYNAINASIKNASSEVPPSTKRSTSQTHIDEEILELD